MEERIPDQPVIGGPESINPMGESEAANAFMNLVQEDIQVPEQAPKPLPEQPTEPEDKPDDNILQFRESEDQPNAESMEGGAADVLNDLIEIGGVKRTAKEWQEGHMMNADYTKKTQMLSEEKRKLESDKEMTNQMREQYVASLGLLTKAAEDDVKQYNGVDWRRMADEAPDEYVRHKAAYDEALRTLDKTRTETKHFFNQVNEESKKMTQQRAVSCVQELKRSFKNWNENTYYELVHYGVESGVDRDFLLNSTDPGVFKALHKARMFDEGRNVKTKEITNAPNRVFGGRNEKGQFTKQGSDALTRLRETGSKHDAAAAMQAFLKGG
jgi:hypothetical protein